MEGKGEDIKTNPNLKEGRREGREGRYLRKGIEVRKVEGKNPKFTSGLEGSTHWKVKGRHKNKS